LKDHYGAPVLQLVLVVAFLWPDTVVKHRMLYIHVRRRMYMYAPFHRARAVWARASCVAALGGIAVLKATRSLPMLNFA
jgi:hypothetical protein